MTGVRGGVGFGCYLRAEAVKLLSHRAIIVVALLSLATGISITWFDTPVVVRYMQEGSKLLAPGLTYEGMGFDMVPLCGLGMVAVGVLCASGEYRDHGLRTSLLVMQKKLPLLVAQTLVLTLFCLVVAMVSVISLSLVSQWRLGELSVIREGIPAELALHWVGGTFYLVVCALISFFLTHAFRDAVVPLFIMTGMSLMTFILLSITTLTRWLPTVVGVMLFEPNLVTSSYPEVAMSVPTAVAVLVGWTTLSGAIAFVLFARRSAQ